MTEQQETLLADLLELKIRAYLHEAAKDCHTRDKIEDAWALIDGTDLYTLCEEIVEINKIFIK